MNSLRSDHAQEMSNSPTQLLEALKSLHEDVSKGLNLVDLRSKIETAINKVIKPDSDFSVAIGIFLEKTNGFCSMFYALAPAKAKEKREYLDLQLLPYIGKPYNPPKHTDTQKNILFEAGTPLYAERQPLDKSNKTGDSADKNEYIAHHYKYWRAIDVRKDNSWRKNKQITGDATLYEPISRLAERDGSIDHFYEKLLISMSQIPWLSSDEQIFVVTIFSLSNKESDEDVCKSIAGLIPDCLLGVVIGQLFLSYGLSNTSLHHLDPPLVEEMLTESWKNFIDENIKQMSKDNDFLENSIKHIFDIPAHYSFGKMSVLRHLVNSKYTNDVIGQSTSISDYVINNLSNPMLGVFVDTNLHEQIEKQIIGALQKDIGLNDKEQALLANLSLFSNKIDEEILKIIKKFINTPSLDIRQEVFGILVNALTKIDTYDQDSNLWYLLSDIIKNIESDRDRNAYGSCAASLLTQKSLDNVEHISKHIEDWKLSPQTQNVLLQQLEDVKIRLNRETKDGPRLIGVFSQKGGVGKSTIALAASYLIAEKDHKVCLLEMDFSGPTLYNYKKWSNGPFINDFILHSEEFDWEENGNRRAKDNVFVWPADPRWEIQVISTANQSSFLLEHLREEEMLDDLISQLSKEGFNTIIFDTSAEIKDISRSISGLISKRGGIALMVASLFTPSYGPMIENYWRLLSSENVTSALVVNKIRPLDSNITCSMQSLIDYIITQKNTISLHAFDMEIHSPTILKMLFPMNLVPIKYVEDIERISRFNEDEDITSKFKEMAEFKVLGRFLNRGVNL